VGRNLNPGYQGYEGGVLQFERQVYTRVRQRVSKVSRVQCRLFEPFDQEVGGRERVEWSGFVLQTGNTTAVQDGVLEV
jgi:hypothetical protein